MRVWLALVATCCVVAFGQPAWLGWLGPVAAAVGYAGFWATLQRVARGRFWIATAWFSALSAVQLSWMSATQYMGPLIVIVHAGLSILWGLQFAALTHFVRDRMPLSHIAALAGAWVWFEWSRLWILSGYSWNPVGLALAGTVPSLQFASVFGVYGLSFIVIATNLLVFSRRWRAAAVVALVPYAFGAVAEPLWRAVVPVERKIEALLVQTSLRPEEKDFYVPHSSTFIMPRQQWTRILSLIENAPHTPVDLIVLPEAAVPFGAFERLYTHEQIKEVWRRMVGPHALNRLPSLQAPLAEEQAGQWRVTNAYWAQALSNYYNADVIAGLDVMEVTRKWNAAFLFRPGGTSLARYEKRVLVPIGEYIPFSGWAPLARLIAREFQIEESFTPGSEARVFPGILPYGVTICYEETFAHMVRESVRCGADVLINVTNDVWFPHSKLPRQHLEHARLRAVELGRTLVRACNTGITAVIDPFGRTVAELPEQEAGVLRATVPVQKVPTLYLLWGNGAILAIGAAAIAIARNRSMG